MTTFDATLDRLFNSIIAIESEAIPTDRIAANVRMNRLRGIRVRIDRMLFGDGAIKAPSVTYTDKPAPKPKPEPKPQSRMPRPRKPQLHVTQVTLPDYDDTTGCWRVVVTFSDGQTQNHDHAELGASMQLHKKFAAQIRTEAA